MINLRDFATTELVFDAKNHIFYPQSRAKRQGISERYISGATNDAERFLNLQYPFEVITDILTKNNFDFNNKLILDVASGFGNTVLPMLRDFKSIEIVATDLSDSMLGVLRQHAINMNIEERLTLLEIDALQIDIFKPSSFDLVVGGAALHHFKNPELVLKSCIKALKPGGLAIFLEPMEIGLTLFALSLEQVIPEFLRSESSESKLAAAFFVDIIKDITYRARRFTDNFSPKWEDLDDKWVFAKSYLERIAQENNASITFQPLNSLEEPFLKQAETILKIYGQIEPKNLFTDQVRNRFREFEQRFSKDAIQDSPMEAAITLKKIDNNFWL